MCRRATRWSVIGNLPPARGRSGALAAVALACAAATASCRAAEAGVEPPAPDAGVGAGATAGARAAVIERLARLNRSGQFLFGQENATLWGMYLDGELASTGKWFEKTARAGHFVADTEALVGDRPAVLGVSLDMLLDGRPVGFGQAVVPMAAMADNAHLYYGNNVRLAQRGTYQVFVRLTRTVLLGKDQPQAAQFNVVVR